MPAKGKYDERAYKKSVTSFFIYIFFIFLIPSAALVLLFYIADPLQLYHRSWFHRDKFIPSQHEQIAGIINSLDFDSVILGTSLLQNTSAKEAGSLLGGNFANISIAGSNLVDRRVILERAMSKKKLRHVILSIEPWYYLECIRDNDSYPRRFWDFLYDDNPFNDMKVYFSAKFLANPTQSGVLQDYDPDAPFAWHRQESALPFFDGLKKWAARPDDRMMKKFVYQQVPNAVAAYGAGHDNEKISVRADKLKAARKYIDENVVGVVKKYPQTKFSLVMPPFARFYYADLWHREPENFYLHQEITRYLVESLAGLDNAKLYGFEDSPLLDDMSNYRDDHHYLSPLNSWITRAIAAGEHRLTPGNIDAYLDDCRKMAQAYDLPAFHRQVEEILRSGARATTSAKTPG